MILHVLVSVLISIFYEISVLENFFLCVCVCGDKFDSYKRKRG